MNPLQKLYYLQSNQHASSTSLNNQLFEENALQKSQQSQNQNLNLDRQKQQSLSQQIQMTFEIEQQRRKISIKQNDSMSFFSKATKRAEICPISMCLHRLQGIQFDLPHCLLFNVFQYLNYFDHLKICLVSFEWLQVAKVSIQRARLPNFDQRQQFAFQRQISTTIRVDFSELIQNNHQTNLFQQKNPYDQNINKINTQFVC